MKPGRVLLEFTTKDGRACTLRGLARTDLDGLLKFANGFVREKRKNRDLGVISFDKRMTRREEGKWLNRIIQAVREREAVSIGAFVDGRLVGHCDIHRRSMKDVRHSGVLGIAIFDGYRGVGIGEKLMTTALEEAKKMGLRLVELQVFAINRAAVHLYEKVGFKTVGVVPNKMLRQGRYLDEVVMYADLGTSDKSPSTGRRQS